MEYALKDIPLMFAKAQEKLILCSNLNFKEEEIIMDKIIWWLNEIMMESRIKNVIEKIKEMPEKDITDKKFKAYLKELLYSNSFLFIQSTQYKALLNILISEVNAKEIEMLFYLNDILIQKKVNVKEVFLFRNNFYNIIKQKNSNSTFSYNLRFLSRSKWNKYKTGFFQTLDQLIKKRLIEERKGPCGKRGSGRSLHFDNKQFMEEFGTTIENAYSLFIQFYKKENGVPLAKLKFGIKKMSIDSIRENYNQVHNEDLRLGGKKCFGQQSLY